MCKRRAFLTNPLIIPPPFTPRVLVPALDPIEVFLAPAPAPLTLILSPAAICVCVGERGQGRAGSCKHSHTHKTRRIVELCVFVRVYACAAAHWCACMWHVYVYKTHGVFTRGMRVCMRVPLTEKHGVCVYAGTSERGAQDLRVLNTHGVHTLGMCVCMQVPLREARAVEVAAGGMLLPLLLAGYS